MSSIFRGNSSKNMSTNDSMDENSVSKGKEYYAGKSGMSKMDMEKYMKKYMRGLMDENYGVRMDAMGAKMNEMKVSMMKMERTIEGLMERITTMERSGLGNKAGGNYDYQDQKASSS